MLNHNIVMMKGMINLIEITNGQLFNTTTKSFETKNIKIKSQNNETIDAQEKYIIPGLTDMHTHISPFYAKYYLLSSVTNTRNTAGIYDLIQKVDEVSPTIYPTYRMIDGEPGLWGPTGVGHVATDDINEALEVVRENHKQGAKFIKVYGHIKPSVLKAVINEANKYDLHVAADLLHATSVNALDAGKLGVKYLEHASGILQCLYKDYVPGDFEKTFANQTVDLDSDKLNEVLTELKKMSVTLVPTLSLYRKNALGKITVTDDPFIRDMRADEAVTLDKMFESLEEHRSANYKRYAEWEYAIMKIITKRYIDIGGEVYIGTDAPAGFWNYPGLSMIEEMQIFNELGIDANEVLYHAIEPPQNIVGRHDNYVILNKNPLDTFDNLTSVSGVVINGTYYSRDVISSHQVDTESIYRLFE